MRSVMGRYIAVALVTWIGLAGAGGAVAADGDKPVKKDATLGLQLNHPKERCRATRLSPPPTPRTPT